MNSMLLEVEKGKPNPKAYAVVANQRDKTENREQRHWYFEDAGDGFVYIVSKLNGLVLDIKGHSHKRGTYLILFPRKPAPLNVSNQKWKLKGDVIESQLNQMVVSIKGGEQARPGAFVVTWPIEDEKQYQQWVFEVIEEHRHLFSAKTEQHQLPLPAEKQPSVSETKQPLASEETTPTGADDDDQPQGESLTHRMTLWSDNWRFDDLCSDAMLVLCIPL